MFQVRIVVTQKDWKRRIFKREGDKEAVSIILEAAKQTTDLPSVRTASVVITNVKTGRRIRYNYECVKIDLTYKPAWGY